jgi:hypothetical protein
MRHTLRAVLSVLAFGGLLAVATPSARAGDSWRGGNHGNGSHQGGHHGGFDGHRGGWNGGFDGHRGGFNNGFNGFNYNFGGGYRNGFPGNGPYRGR